LYNPNPYQLGIDVIKDKISSCRIWAKSTHNTQPTQQKRREKITEKIGKELQNAEELKDGPLSFSSPFPHGKQGEKTNNVIISRIEEDGISFVHASDIQLLDAKTIELILDWKTDIVLASGPPLYHYSSVSFQKQRENVWQNALNLSDNVNTLMIADTPLFM